MTDTKWVGLPELAKRIEARSAAEVGHRLETLGLRTDRRPTARAYELGLAIDVHGTGRESERSYVSYKWNEALILPILLKRPRTLEQRISALEMAYRTLRETGRFVEL